MHRCSEYFDVRSGFTSEHSFIDYTAAREQQHVRRCNALHTLFADGTDVTRQQFIGTCSHPFVVSVHLYLPCR